MSELISLLSDSEDEEPSMAPVGQNRRSKAASHSEVVELLSDSSDEEETSPSMIHQRTRNIKNRTTALVKPKVAVNAQSKLYQRKLDFTSTRQGRNIGSPEISRASSSKAIRAKRMRSPFQEEQATKKLPPVASSPTQSNCYNALSDSESDDDSILQFESGLSRKKTTTAPSQVALASSPIHVNVREMTVKSSGNDFSIKVTPESATKVLHSTRPKLLNPYSKKSTLNDQIVASNTEYASSQAGSFPSNFWYPALFSPSKRHEDIRAKLIVWLWRKAKSMVQFSHDGKKLQSTVKRIAHLALSLHPIRSVDEYYGRYFNVGGIKSTAGRIVRQDVASENDIKAISTPISCDGRYYSIAEACLVAMLDIANMKNSQKDTSSGVETQLANEIMWVPLEDLIPEIDKRLKVSCPGRLTRRSDADNGSAFYNEKSTRSAEYLQIKCLLKKSGYEEMPLMKQRTRRTKIFFELTLDGYQTAQRIRDRTFPAPPGHYRVSNLETVQSTYDNICLGVDSREGGGPASKLHIMYVSKWKA